MIGGNGAIGVRLVEQLVMMHNSTANIYAVDIAPQPFSLPIDATHNPHAAHRLAYRQLPRYLVSDGCRPIVLDRPLSAPVPRPDQQAIAAAILRQLATPTDAVEFALTNSYPLEPDALAQLWHTVADHSGYVVADDTALPGDAGRRYHLRRDGNEVAIALLVAGTVLTFADSARLIRSGVTTVIGCTGYPAFEARHLDEFLSRSGPSQQVDTLTLISASSKDYEFRQVIDLLDFLLLLQSPTMLTVSARLEWFRKLYTTSMSFVHGEHFAPLQRLLASALGEWAIGAWQSRRAQTSAATIGFRDENEDTLRACLRFAITIWRRITIRKAIHPDIGSVYHLTIDGQAKQIVLLADGFVINFFARHEKGVKTEFIHSVITLQVLGLVQLLTEAPPPGLHTIGCTPSARRPRDAVGGDRRELPPSAAVIGLAHTLCARS